MRQLFFNAFTLRAADGAFTPRSARRPVPSHHAARGGRCFRTTQHAAKQCPRFVLVADCRGRSLKKNRTSDKLELTLSDMSEVLLFFLFVSLPAVPAPAEVAPALSRRALQAEVKRSTIVRLLVVPAPEVAGEEDDDGEEFQSADNHERAQIDLQGRVEEREVPGGRAEAEGCACIREHAQS